MLENCTNVTFRLTEWPENSVPSASIFRVFLKNALDPLFWRLSKPRLSKLLKTSFQVNPVQTLGRRLGFGWYKWLRIHQEEWEFSTLLDTLRTLDPSRIIEIGSHYGGSFLVWADIAKEQVISVDIPAGKSFFLKRRKLWKMLLGRYKQKSFTLIGGDSHHPATIEAVAEALNGRRCDFLFIDGDHTEWGVEKDYAVYRQFVREGGLIAFHDILPHTKPEDSQVDIFWARIKSSVECKEIVHNRNQGWAGIGLVQC